MAGWWVPGWQVYVPRVVGTGYWSGYHIWDQFWTSFGPVFGPDLDQKTAKNSSKPVSKLVKKRTTFGPISDPFLTHFGPFLTHPGTLAGHPVLATPASCLQGPRVETGLTLQNLSFSRFWGKKVTFSLKTVIFTDFPDFHVKTTNFDSPVTFL